MKIYIINGHPRAGKDTFVKFCSEFAPTANYSTVMNVDGMEKKLLKVVNI